MLCLATDHDDRICCLKNGDRGSLSGQLSHGRDSDDPQRPDDRHADLLRHGSRFVDGYHHLARMESVLSLSNHIVVTWPGSDLSFDHVTDLIRGRIVDLRGKPVQVVSTDHGSRLIYVTDSVFGYFLGDGYPQPHTHRRDLFWADDVLPEVANTSKNIRFIANGRNTRKVASTRHRKDRDRGNADLVYRTRP